MVEAVIVANLSLARTGQFNLHHIVHCVLSTETVTVSWVGEVNFTRLNYRSIINTFISVEISFPRIFQIAAIFELTNDQYFSKLKQCNSPPYMSF